MKPKTSVYFCFILVLLFCGNAFAQSQNVEKAKELWEKAIEAKGGREKLYAVRNMVVSSRSKTKYSFFKTSQMFEESLYVFPDKMWTWLDNRPSIFGLRIMMYDYKTQMKYHQILDSSSNVNKLVPFEPSELKKKNLEMISLIFDLMETYWLKPVPESVTKGKIGSKRVDIIKTNVEGERFDFALDQKTHLPIQITHFYYEPISKMNLQIKLNFSEYKQVDGIMMASVKRPANENGRFDESFQFNVKYDESIFTTPPSFEDGSGAWKPKVKE